jgi:polar amino acid transport system substrate-binding protein
MQAIFRSILALLALSLSPLTAQPAKPRLVFATDPTQPPMEFFGPHKKIIGFDLDMIQAAAKAAGFKADIRSTPWVGIFSGLAAGRYDAVLSSVTITDERAKTMDFSQPYMDTGLAILVRKDTGDITGLAQFAGKKVGAAAGTVSADAVASQKDIELKTYNDNDESMLDDLGAGRIDAAVMDEVAAIQFARKDKRYSNKFIITGGRLQPGKFGIAVRKGDQKTLDLVNKGLEAITQDGTLDRLTTKWLK